MKIADFGPLTTQERIADLANEAEWALRHGLLTFEADGLNFTSLGTYTTAAYRAAEADDTEAGRLSATYNEGRRLHWLAVALGTGHPLEAVDQGSAPFCRDESGGSLLESVTSRLAVR